MPELTDSYCERCGIRHVFSSSGSKGLSLKGARVLVKGLKNFVLNDGQSMGDSITTARLEADNGDSSRITEAFYKAFHFCMTCRQYACDNCWNARVGACFTCAPQVDSAAVAPEGRLIVRTPVARWDPDSLNFGGSKGDSAASASNPSLPAEWPGPLQISPIIPPQARQDHFTPRADQTTAPAQPSAWPAADLPRPTAADAGANGKTGRGGRKPADPGSWKQWPVADELAPEMTLTPEEMMLVEAELSHPESGEPARASTPSVEDVGIPAAGPGLEPVPSGSTLSTWEPLAPSQPFRPISAPLSPPTPPLPNRSVSAAADSMAAAAAETTPTPQATPTAKTPVTPESRPDSPMRAAPPPVLPAQPGPSAATQHEPVERVGLVARLLGRRHAIDKRGATHIYESTAGSGVETQAWPRATPWAETPLSGRRWPGDSADAPSYINPRVDESAQPAAEYPDDLAADLRADVPVGLVPDQTAPPPLPERIGRSKRVLTSLGALEPASKSPDRPAAAAAKPADFDAALARELRDAAALGEARSAAAIRQSAVANSPNRPADERTAAAPPVAQSEAPARPEADAEVAEIAEVALPETASQPGPVAQATDAVPVEPSTPPASWPPFGASWPAPAAHRGTWPGPAAPLPAVVAAQQAQPQFAVEMWAQSSQEVMNRGTVRVCHRCALPVSTQARFCRRCGTQQA
jgi:ribosomal protein L40E